MAEKRLMDDDKDKKYRFRINADGEEELDIDMGGEQTYRDGDEEELAEHAFDDDYVYGGEACSDGEAVEGLLASARAGMAAGRVGATGAQVAPSCRKQKVFCTSEYFY